MYKPLKAADLTALKAKRVEMLCFAEYSLYIHFGDAVILTIEGEFDHILGNNKEGEHHSFPIEGSHLTRLLGHLITSIGEDKDRLMLKFSNGDRLILPEEGGPYESYRIEHRGNEIIV